ncbi:MAG: lysophospholipid acyltransferase family protein [Candidatus Cloacimonetes bacterium]|nr:lysophospholipid acyltransferase family protein [Candidatus Cloacimonadota bacterium]
MVKSLLWKIWFIFFMLLCMLAFFILLVCKLLLPKGLYRKVVYTCVRFWGRQTVLSTGSKVELSGMENLPVTNDICFVANHQGMFDIPLVLGFIAKPSGFIAKQELLKIPVLSWWMLEIPCVFIDRGSARAAMESFKKSAEVIQNGHPQVIFPEGTRSRGDQMGEFHLGSLKLAFMANAAIVPLAIKGTWRVHEIDKGIHAVPLKLRILPAITPDDELYKDKHRLSEHLYDQISTALSAM